MAIQRFVRYGTTKDARHLGGIRDDVDGLVVGANMAVHARQALFGFIQTTMCGKPYIIDPLTHAFQHDITLLTSVNKKTGEIRLKRSWSRLRTEYGLPDYIELPELRALSPQDIDVPALAKLVVAFQSEFTSRELQDSPDRELYTWLESKQGEDGLSRPYGIIAPYFFPESGNEQEWLGLNRRCLEETRELIPDDTMLAEVLVPDVTDSEVVEAICNSLKGLKVDGILLWLDNFDEHTARAGELRAYIKLLQRLGKIADVVSLYGGYFSVVCGRIAGQPVGVCHGMEYGESRSVIPVGGGLPFARFYYPALHQRVRYRDSLPIVRQFLGSPEDYHQNVCSCSVCRDLVTRHGPSKAFELYGESREVSFKRKNQEVVIDYPTPEAAILCLKHYLEVKTREYSATDSEPGALLEEMREASERYRDIGGPGYVSHLNRWCTALKEVLSACG